MTTNTPDRNDTASCACCGRWSAVLRETMDWVFLAAAFGLFFNLYDSDGIELRAKPKIPPTYQNLANTAPVTYAGFKIEKPASKPSPKAARFPILSLQGARLRHGKALFVDARPAKDYAEGHITGAIPFDVNDFDHSAPKALQQLPTDREIVVYCSGGDCDDSLMLAGKLKDLGYKDMKLYEGGYPEWRKAGLPVAKGEAP